jgi:hypothetical protein
MSVLISEFHLAKQGHYSLNLKHNRHVLSASLLRLGMHMFYSQNALQDLPWLKDYNDERLK